MDKKDKISGIYTITNVINNKLYVGCSVDINKRLLWHKHHLRKNTHINDRLQKSYTKYGESNFIFEILEICEESYMYSQEHYWCNILNSHDEKYGFNLQPTDPHDIRIFSKETRQKISEKNKGKIVKESTRILKSIIAKKYEHNIKQKIPVIQYDKNHNYIKEWDSIKEAHKGTGSSLNSIKLQCHSYMNNVPRKKTTCKFIWKFKNCKHE